MCIKFYIVRSLFIMEQSLSKLKRALTVLFFVTVALLVAFVALYLLEPIVGHILGLSKFGDNVTVDFSTFTEAFIMPFARDPSAYSSLEVFCSFFSMSALGMSIAIYVLSGIVFVLIVLGIVFTCSKHKGIYSLYSLMLVVVYYATIMTMLYFWPMIVWFKNLGASGISFYLMAVEIVGILLFLSCLATYIVGLVYVKKLFNAALTKEEEDAKAIAEAAGDPEAVQEAEALDDEGAEPVIVEAEPEPVPEEPVEEEVVEPIEEPIEEKVEEEPAPVVEEKIEEEPKEVKEDKQHVEVNVNNNGAPQGGIDNASLASLLREVVRDIVRDEIARSNANQPAPAPAPVPNGNQTITGATFGGPLVVQYFNGGINGVTTPAPSVVENKTVEKVVEVRREEPAPAPAPAPAPVVEEAKVEEPKKEEVKPEPAPAAEAAPRPLFVKKEPAPTPAKPEEPVVEAKKYERISFAERLLQSESDIHALYNEIKNEILSWGVKSRISAVGDTFRLHKKMYVRITVAGKSLKLYFALNPQDYANGTIPVQDASDKDMYQEIPLVFKVKSPLSVRRCKELIQDVMEKDGLEQGEVGKVNWIKELKAEIAAEKKKEKVKE